MISYSNVNYSANPSAAISNYIQLIWAYTQYVGCGVAFYSSVATEVYVKTMTGASSWNE